MAFIVWKLIRGKGPYAYLRQSERVDGRVVTRHLAYLGYWSAEGGTLGPGSMVTGPNGEELVVPGFSPSLLLRLGTTAEAVGRSLATTSEGSGLRLATTTEKSESQLATTEDDPLATTREEAQGLLATTELGTTGEGHSGGPTQAASVRPHRLPDGSWGVFSVEPLAAGDLVEVTTASGQTWTATVVEALEPTPRGFVARTSGRPRGSG